MTDDDILFELEDEYEVPFRLLDGSRIPLHVSRVHVGDTVEVTAQVAVPTWERLYADGAFHLDGEPEPAGFEPDHPVTLLLRLRAPIAARHGDPDELLNALLGDASSPLQATEAWEALEATQRLDVPGTDGEWVDIGLRTRFADPVTGRPAR